MISWNYDNKIKFAVDTNMFVILRTDAIKWNDKYKM